MGRDRSYDRDFLGAVTSSLPQGPRTYPFLLWASVSVNGDAHCSTVSFQLLEIDLALHRCLEGAGAGTGGSPVPSIHSHLGSQGQPRGRQAKQACLGIKAGAPGCSQLNNIFRDPGGLNPGE